MGWHGGSSIMRAVIEGVRQHVADEAVREEIYSPILDALERQDWSDVLECAGLDPACDRLLHEQLGYEVEDIEQAADGHRSHPKDD